MDLTTLREETEALSRAWVLWRYREHAGIASGDELEALFRAAPEVATWESVTQVREAAASAEGRRAPRLRALSHQLVRLVAAREGSGAGVAWTQASRVLVSGTGVGQQWPLRAAFQLLAQEPARESRAEAERRVLAAAVEHERAPGRVLDSMRRSFQRAGWPTLEAAWSAFHDLEFDELAVMARELLAETDAMYHDVSAWWLRRTTGLRPFPHEAERHDLLHALTLREFEGLFPNRSDLPRLLNPFRKSGVNPSLLRLDTEARPMKDVTPFVAGANPPAEVWAVLRREGGFQSARDLLRCWGEASHFQSVEAERPFEDRLLGDSAVPRAIGLLFQSVLLDKGWLKVAVDQVPPDFRRVVALHELFLLRRAAVLALTVSESDSAGARERFSEQASSVLGARWPGDLLPWEKDPELEAATDLLAAALSGALLNSVVEQFDEDWWANPRAAAWLRKLLSQGQFESARALAESRQLGALSLRPAVVRLQQLFD